MKAPANLPTLAISDQQAGEQQQTADRFEDREVGAEAGQAEEHRHEQRRDQAAQLLLDMPRQDRRSPDQDAGDEGAEHGVDADAAA